MFLETNPDPFLTFLKAVLALVNLKEYSKTIKLKLQKMKYV